MLSALGVSTENIGEKIRRGKGEGKGSPPVTVSHFLSTLRRV